MVGAIFQRRRRTGISLAVFGAAAVLVGAGVAMKATPHWWSSITRFLGDQSSLMLLAAVPLVVALACGGAAWPVLRRATT